MKSSSGWCLYSSSVTSIKRLGTRQCCQVAPVTLAALNQCFLHPPPFPPCHYTQNYTPEHKKAKRQKATGMLDMLKSDTPSTGTQKLVRSGASAEIDLFLCVFLNSMNKKEAICKSLTSAQHLLNLTLSQDFHLPSDR